MSPDTVFVEEWLPLQQALFLHADGLDQVAEPMEKVRACRRHTNLLVRSRE